jgi:capsular polysaccharide export protein
VNAILAEAPGAGNGERSFLLVSAPFGPFGRELAAELRGAGARAARVVLNGGDLLDWGLAHSAPFQGRWEDWSPWLVRTIVERGVTDLVTYGDSSPHADAALAAGSALGVRGHVLEQGYLRPNWVTLEQGGVNANSRLPRDPDWYRREGDALGGDEGEPVGRTTAAQVARIVAYHAATYVAAPFFRRYRAHYSEPALRQAAGHMARHTGQLMSRGRRRRAYEAALAASGQVFLCALQRPGDSQLWRHSDYANPCEFVEHVVSSFAAHAAPDAWLLVRPHPLDHGLAPHGARLTQAARALNVADRVAFSDWGHLHEVLPRMAGVVCINSTAGLAAVEFNRPTITLGRAIYDMAGMTHQGSLDTFWRDPQSPDPDLYRAFRRVLLARTQVNGAYATALGRRLAVHETARRLLAAGAARFSEGEDALADQREMVLP